MIFKIKIFVLEKEGITVIKSKYKIDVGVLKN